MRFDLTKPGAPLKWKYEPKPEAASQGVACCDVVNRGAVFADGRIFYNTLDGNTIAVDAKTGKEVWHTKLGNINLGETITMAPARGEGQGAGRQFRRRDGRARLDRGPRCERRQARVEGLQHRPRRRCADRPRLQAVLRTRIAARISASRRWPPDAWKIGGGNVWGWISYDPDLNLIYYGSGNPGPWNPDQRPGDNKWTTDALRARRRYGPGALVLSDDPARSVRLRRRQREHPARHALEGRSRARC